MAQTIDSPGYSREGVTEIQERTPGIDQNARKKIINCKLLLMTKAAFFGQLSMSLDFIERRDLTHRTMATDGFRIYYDPDFVNSKPDYEIKWVICHEIMHCALHHFLRKQANPTVWNAAADYAINQLIDGSGYGDPTQSPFGVMPSGGLLDKKYEGWSAEQIYHHLIENNVELPPEEGWNYGNVEPPVFVEVISGDDLDEDLEEWGEKASVGDYITLPDGKFGRIDSIDDANGDATISALTKKELVKIIESKTGRKIKKII
jgi:hypothetical protein